MSGKRFIVTVPRTTANIHPGWVEIPEGAKVLTRDQLQESFDKHLGITIDDHYGRGLGRSAFHFLLKEFFGEEKS